MEALPLTTINCTKCKQNFCVVSKDIEENRNDLRCPFCRSDKTKIIGDK